MIFTLVKKNKINYNAFLKKLIFSLLFCFISIHASALSIKDSIICESQEKSTSFFSNSVNTKNTQTLSCQNTTKSIKPESIIYITEGTTIVDLQVSESYYIAKHDKKKENK